MRVDNDKDLRKGRERTRFHKGYQSNNVGYEEVKMGKSNDQAHPYIPKYSAPVPNPNIPILGSLS
jgi:hypothetical protein